MAADFCSAQCIMDNNGSFKINALIVRKTLLSTLRHINLIRCPTACRPMLLWRHRCPGPVNVLSGHMEQSVAVGSIMAQ